MININKNSVHTVTEMHNRQLIIHILLIITYLLQLKYSKIFGKNI